MLKNCVTHGDVKQFMNIKILSYTDKKDLLIIYKSVNLFEMSMFQTIFTWCVSLNWSVNRQLVTL